MKQNKISEFTKEQLIKKKELLKGIAIGFGIIYLVIVILLIYILLNSSKSISIAALIPIFVLPVTFNPIFMNLGMINKELKSRK